MVRGGSICGVFLQDALIRSWSLPMSLTKFAVAEAKINRRSEAARRGGDLTGMQQAMAELTALYRAYYCAGEAPKLW
jgi:hypothetical protein